MKAILIAAALATAALSTLAAPVYAAESESMKQAREAQEKLTEDQDRAYRNAIQNTSKPEKAVKVDPWATTRDTTKSNVK